MATLKQGQEYMGGTVQFDSATGQRLNVGQSTYENKDLVQNPTTGAITPASMAPTTAFTPTVPAPQPVVTSPTLPPPVETPVAQPLPQETRIYDLMKELTGETKTLGSQEAFTTQKESQFDVIGKKNAVATLKNQFDALTKANQGIDIQSQQDIENLQLEAQMGGANVTKGGLAPRHREIATRANQAKLTNTIKQYELGAQYAVAQGDLATALDYVDQAVRLEYQPKKDALDAKRANIELLLKDPTLTLAQEKRAMELKREYAKEDAQLEADRKDKETVQGLILQAQQNGADPALVAQARKDGTIFGVGSLLGGYISRETDGEIRRYNEAKRTGFKGSFLDYQKEVERAKLLGKAPTTVKASVPSIVGKDGKYKSDLDAMVGNTFNIIPTKFGQESFANAISKSRNDSDKLTAIATIALTKATADERKDFVSQAQGVKNIEKAIAMLDEGVQTGRVQQGKQYVYNLAGGDFDPKLAQLNQYITSAIQPYRTSITGAAWGEQEDAEYQQLFGSSGYTPEALKTRLQGLKEILTSKSSTALQAYVSPLGVFGGETNPFQPQMNDEYGSYRAQLQGDEILVNRGGRMMAIPSDELLDTDEQL